MDIKESIEATKRGFEESFKEGNYYNKQTQDYKHLNKILDKVTLNDGMKLLDLGTGSGYLAFEAAKRNRNVYIIGLDIVEEALKSNRKKAKEDNIHNIDFITYDGLKFPFEDNTFDYITARYCIHHFPAIEETFKEVSRVLKSGGILFISDPVPNEIDTTRFVDEYMKMKKDGAKELPEILKRHDSKIIESYNMNITENDIYLTEQVINVLFQKK